MRTNLFLLVAAYCKLAAQAPNPPPPPPPNPNWQTLLGADPALQTDAVKIAASEATVAATLSLPPTSGRPTASIDWEGTGSACAAFVNLYKLTGSQPYKTSAQQIADNFIAWNDWLVANRNATIPYTGWGPETREAEFGCPAVSGYYADDLWDTSGALRCLLKYSETDPNPSSTTYFARAKKVIDEWPYFAHASGDPSAPALANDGPYAAYGMRFYRKSNDPCDVRYVKNTNIAMTEQLFRVYRINQDPAYLDAATRALYGELWDILTHQNFGYNGYMIYDDISNPIYAKSMVPENNAEVDHSGGALVCINMDPPSQSTCWDHLGFEGFETSVIEQLINTIPAGQFPVASTIPDLAAATETIMAHYQSSGYGNASEFNWASWLASGVESPTYVTAYNCAQRFSTDPVFYAQCQTAFNENPNYSLVSRGDVLYSLVPDAIFTPNLAQGAVVNAASSAGGAVSPGELVTIYGSGIGPATSAGLQLDQNGNVSINLAGTSVLFDGVPAPVIYTSALQTSVVVPYEIASQAATEMQVEYHGVVWKRYPLMVSASTPGVFNAILNQDTSRNTPSNPASKGSVVVLFATGGGQTVPPGADGVLSGSTLPQPALPVSVTIGGQPAVIAYSGAAPGAVAGVMQINCIVPASVAPGNLNVLLTIGNASSPAGVTVAVN